MTVKSREAEAADAQAIVTLTVGQLKEAVRDAVREIYAERENAPVMINSRTLAQRIGISERAILDLRKAGMPCVMIGDSPRFQLGEVISWLCERDTNRVALELKRINLERGEPNGNQATVIGELARRALEAGLRPGQEIELGNGATFKRGRKTK